MAGVDEVDAPAADDASAPVSSATASLAACCPAVAMGASSSVSPSRAVSIASTRHVLRFDVRDDTVVARFDLPLL
jgi:hypothetical protein